MDIFKPVHVFAEFLVQDVFRIPAGTYWADTVIFFIYDTIKIGCLLVAINYLMAIIRYYFPVTRIREVLSKRRWFGLDYLLAALLGIITPFCSCSSIPLFIGFLSAGIPIGVTFAFLICSPLVNESSLYLFPALFGMKVTIVYNLIGIAVAIAGGALLQRLNVQRYVKSELLDGKARGYRRQEDGGPSVSLGKKVVLFWDEGMQITRQIFPYMVLGVGVGAFIHGFVPKDLVERYFSTKSWWSIPLVTLLGAPFYANSVSVIPVMEAMVGKGVPLGTALTFMTSIVTISIPEMLILKKVMKGQLLALFFGITIIGIMVMGYVLNILF